MTSPDQFTVSLPDVTGFAEQIRSLSPAYENLSEVFVGLSRDIQEGGVLGTDWTKGGALSGILASFVDELDKLLTAEQDACLRLAGELSLLGVDLEQTRNEYASHEAKAEERLNSGDLSGDEKQDAKEIADSVTGGEPKADWTRRVDTAGVDELDSGSADYKAHPMTYKDFMSEQEGIWGQVLSGSISGTLSAIVLELTGFDPLKEAIKPFTGNWGFLWYLGDVFRAAAQVVTDMATMLRNGVSVMLDGIWTGAAAEEFATRCGTTSATLVAHADNLAAAADMVSSMGDEIDAAGNKIAPMLQVLADIGIAIIESLATWNPIPAAIGIGKAALEQLMQGCQPIIDALDGIGDVVETANSSTGDLVGEADALGN